MLTLNGNEITQEEVVFHQIKARIRDVRISLAGVLYTFTDSDQGKVIRISPARTMES